MIQEIETKFDIPETADEARLIEKLEQIVQAAGFIIPVRKRVCREFQYYDTLALNVYHHGETVRRVGGFDPAKDKATFRYDFKVGPPERRYEANHWSPTVLTPGQIVEQFQLQEFYQELFPSASAATTHQKLKIQRGETLIEATFDYFNVHEGAPFRELELELERGEVSDLIQLSAGVQQSLRLQSVRKQKYSRVIESMPKYRDLVSTLRSDPS